MESIEQIKQQALGEIAFVNDVTALRDVEVKYLGRAGKLTEILRGLKDLSEDDRHEQGRAANELRVLLETEIESRRKSLENAGYEENLQREKIDITAPGRKHVRGHLHPLTIIRRDIEQIFVSMGFEIAEGPELEYEWYNFDALNIPEHHPARDMQDTFWVKAEPDSQKGRLVPRTHTSPVQVRYMQTHNPPFRIIIPGRVFRQEASDASHSMQFDQLESLMVGRDVSAANFKAIIQTLFSKLFRKDVQIRMRPSYFPFTEPSFEVDMTCLQCAGSGCSVCKHSGWLEMGGAGMVHPNVFKAAGYNPKDVQGFAFGFGIDRLALMKYKIPDIRLLYQNDIRFLRQF
jgi:phenylalanyl-tRNA synthetase alpha chain